MSASNSMTREELLEYAALDAFGLLDEYEAALYTRSFHNAPAAVQDQIVQMQAHLVSDESLLPSLNPDPTLRRRVLDAVAVAMEQETAQLEPLATIGRPQVAAETAPPMRLGMSGQFWRAAAFALCAGLLVVAYFFSQISAQHSRIAEIALQRNTDAQLEELIGPTFKEFLFTPTSSIVMFDSLAGGVNPDPRAVMYIAEGTGKAFLIVENLPQLATADSYTLVIKDAAGQVDEVRRFESNGKLTGMHVALTSVAGRIQNAAWEIRGPTGVLLASI